MSLSAPVCRVSFADTKWQCILSCYSQRQRVSWLLRARPCVAPGPSACVQLRPTLPSCRASLTTDVRHSPFLARSIISGCAPENTLTRRREPGRHRLLFVGRGSLCSPLKLRHARLDVLGFDPFDSHAKNALGSSEPDRRGYIRVLSANDLRAALATLPVL